MKKREEEEQKKTKSVDVKSSRSK